jgi:NADPH:quinone reductase
MRCYKVKDNKIQLTSTSMPELKDSEVLIKVDSIGINRADLMQINGIYPSPDGSDIPGLEIAGIRMDTKQRVAALLTSGGYAEYVAVNKSHIIPIPDEMDLIEAATLPEALSVTWLNLYELAGIKSQDPNIDKILIHGGASGIGHIMVQFAVNEGFTVYTTARNIKKLSHFSNSCHTIGFDENFEDYISYHGKVRTIIDILGAKYLHANIASCTYAAKIIMLSSMSGRVSELDLGALLMKNISIIKGKIRIIVSRLFPFEKMTEAHDYLKSGNNIGKIVVKI